jgi:acetyl-CoA C-acetyltransferase/acetyl-CoA acyltransferase
MTEAVIVSTARTPFGKAFRGAFNDARSSTLLGHAIAHAVERAGIAPDRIEDAVMGGVLTAGTAGSNIARQTVIAAGLPVSASAQTIDRQCASGLMAIATLTGHALIERRRRGARH